MKILIEITEQELEELKNILRISNKEFDKLYYSSESIMSNEARIVRARKAMGMSMNQKDVCYDLSGTP